MDDPFDEFLRDAAQDYQRPPETPREEIWARIEAARRAQAVSETLLASPDAVDLAERRWQRWRRFGGGGLIALAAVLILGIAVGRWSIAPTGTAPTPAPTGQPSTDRGTRQTTLAARLAAVEHLTQVEALLTDYQSGRVDAEFQGLARELLVRTRLWLDADRIDDPRLRGLLEDLELVLVQIALLPSDGQTEERALIDDGLAERQIRPRLRNAIPAGPAA